MNNVLEECLRISAKDGISVEDAAVSLYEDSIMGEVRFIDPDPPRSFAAYIGSLYSVWFWLVVVGVSSMWLSIYVLPQSPPFNWLRVSLGFLLSLYLPGFVFIEALYPKREELEELERFALSIGLSLALTPLVGFVLNYTPWGIRLNSITVGISIVTFTLGLLGVFRKYQYHMLGLRLRDEA